MTTGGRSAAIRVSRAAGAVARLALGALVLATLATAVGPGSNPAPVAASTATDMETQLLNLINGERAKLGLVGLRGHPGLADLAGDRAAYQASVGQLVHISCLSCTLTGRGIQWYYAGEVISYTTYPWGSQAAQSIFSGWMKSDRHRGILMSSRFNYIGLGVAYGSSGGATYASGVVTESNDLTKPWARLANATRKGTTLTWTWSGADYRLQTHTAGLKSFDVQYRIGTGTWTTIRSATTATSISLSRGSGTYGIRVRARDNRDYLSSWTAEVRLTVP